MRIKLALIIHSISLQKRTVYKTSCMVLIVPQMCECKFMWRISSQEQGNEGFSLICHLLMKI